MFADGTGTGEGLYEKINQNNRKRNGERNEMKEHEGQRRAYVAGAAGWPGLKAPGF